MSKAASKAKHADDLADRMGVRLMYIIRHTDREGLALLEKIRSDLREIRVDLDDIRFPNSERARRVADEVAMTGLEQEIVA
jgi:hypothetical protein